MDKQAEVREKIEGAEYTFLSENPDLSGLIYLTISGSYAYGTNISTSDLDLRGVVIESKNSLIGLSEFEQFEERNTDTVLYGLKKFAKLCLAGNPSVLEILGAPDDCVVRISEAGILLRENVSAFFSMRVQKSFGEYAAAQLRRLTNALCHDAYTQAEQEKYLGETLKKQIDHFNRTYTPLQGGLRIFTLEDEICFDVNLTAYPVRDFIGIYSEMQNIIRTYGKLNHRNRKKDLPHLYKHAMHLIRLLMTGMDILSGHGLVTRRVQEQQLLLDIRDGKYPFEEVFAMADEYRIRFEEAASKSHLPKSPDENKVNKLLYAIYETGGYTGRKTIAAL